MSEAKMNVLFSTFCKVDASKGGTERATITIASGLQRLFGCRCFSLYEQPATTPKDSCFVEEFLWSVLKNNSANVRFLRAILTSNRIDAVIIQGSFIHVKRFREAVADMNCKIILAHHFEPGGESVYFSFRDVCRETAHSLRDLCRKVRNIILFPYLRKLYLRKLSDTYRDGYENADHVVLLSHKYIESFQQFGHFNDINKFVIIPNALSFSNELAEAEISEKKTVALIVSRLDERHKRLSMAIKIWGIVKKDAAAKEWVLKVVGHGIDENRYKRLVRTNNIPDIYFMGRHNSTPYYQEASVFLMTSNSESWGLTLTEAQQMGCVPIAFDSYPTLTDILTDGYDGVVISKGDIDSYCKGLIELMSNDSLRHNMAINGLKSCKRFSQEKIVGMWWNLLINK